MSEQEIILNLVFFVLIYGSLIIIPCLLIAFIGKKMIAQMGRYPTASPIIQMNVAFKLLSIQIITFCLMIGFYRYLFYPE